MAVVRAAARRGHVYLVQLDPTLGSEITTTHPCVVVSPDEHNAHLRTVIVTPLRTGGRPYPWLPSCSFQNRPGSVALDELQTVDTERLVKSLGRMDYETVATILHRLQEMFGE
ncbi:MAG: type II toxin-antitoxin system PemK/MazF family toxin [Vicinamibacteraceae bacterium]